MMTSSRTMVTSIPMPPPAGLVVSLVLTSIELSQIFKSPYHCSQQRELLYFRSRVSCGHPTQQSSAESQFLHIFFLIDPKLNIGFVAKKMQVVAAAGVVQQVQALFFGFIKVNPVTIN